MFDKRRFGRLLVPIITPFKEDQSVDEDALVAVAEKLIVDRYADTLILTGTTGEFFTLNFEERVRIFRLMQERFGDRIPLIAGTGAASTVETLALTEEAHRAGIDTVMVVAPYYTKPNQREILTHFRTVAERVPVDIMLYNIPIFVGVNVEPATVAELATLPNVVAIKEEAELNPKQMTSYLNVTPDDFIVYCGDDTMVLEALAQGGERIGGFVSGGSHIAGGRIREMIEHFLGGRIEQASAMQRELFELYRSLGQSGRTNPVALLKGAMRLLGYPAGIPRAPLLPATDEEMAVVRAAMQRSGVWTAA
jgi:4-hydroxy-tetrahydrodipicolinate synthase